MKVEIKIYTCTLVCTVILNLNANCKLKKTKQKEVKSLRSYFDCLMGNDQFFHEILLARNLVCLFFNTKTVPSGKHLHETVDLFTSSSTTHTHTIFKDGTTQ